VNEAFRKSTVFFDHILRELRRTSVTTEKFVEGPTCPLLASRPRVFFSGVEIFRESRDG
jgi:hypothetical protein